MIIEYPTTVFTFFFKGSGEISTLHQFTCPSSGCVWTVLEQQLQVPRAKHVAFLIDNSAFNCKQQGNSTELIFWNKSVLIANRKIYLVINSKLKLLYKWTRHFWLLFNCPFDEFSSHYKGVWLLELVCHLLRPKPIKRRKQLPMK